MELKEKLVLLRIRQGLTQSEVAAEIDVSRQAVYKWERGDSTPTADNLNALSLFYGVPMDELLSSRPLPEEEQGEAAESAAAEETAPPAPLRGRGASPFRRRGARLAAGIGLAACLLLMTIAAVITICSAIFKEPEKPKEGRTIIINQDDLEQDYINPEEILDLTGGTKIIVP